MRFTITLLLLQVATFAQTLPDLKRTPGVANPKVTQQNISSTICVSGWTKTIRPPASYTNKLKAQQLGEFGYKDHKLKDFEEDHLISLEIGGNPIDLRNLWPQPYSPKPGAHEKDAVENALHRLVCANKIPLKEAQTCITMDWYKCGKKIGAIK